MKRVSLDTNIFDYCHNNQISANALNKFLDENGLIPFVSFYVTYELARNFLKNPRKAREIFHLLHEIKPKFFNKIEKLYALEYMKLKNNLLVNFEADELLENSIKERILNFSKGIIDLSLRQFIEERQNSLMIVREEYWTPIGEKNDYRKKYNIKFNACMEDFFSSILDNASQRINYVRDIMLSRTKGKILLTDDEILTIVSSKSEYPALIACIRQNTYLNFLTETNKATPSEDRLTDSFIILESSYCEVLLSNDHDFVTKHAKNINPNIEVKKIRLCSMTDKLMFNEE